MVGCDPPALVCVRVEGPRLHLEAGEVQGKRGKGPGCHSIGTRKGSGREDMRAPLSCNLREGDAESRGFLSLFFHQHNCKSHKCFPGQAAPSSGQSKQQLPGQGDLGCAPIQGTLGSIPGMGPTPAHTPALGNATLCPLVSTQQLKTPSSQVTVGVRSGRCAGVSVVTTPGVGTGWDTCTTHLPCWASPSLGISLAPSKQTWREKAPG